jgi:hypothetical protein
MVQRIYRLSAVTPPSEVPGALRPASMEDVDLDVTCQRPGWVWKVSSRELATEDMAMHERPSTDLEVLLAEGYEFVCFICRTEPEHLFRVRLQQWPAGPYPLGQDEPYRIRRRLICWTCLRTFEYPDAGASAIFISARATISGREWCLRQHPFKKPTSYNSSQWARYVARTRSRRTH